MCGNIRPLTAYCVIMQWWWGSVYFKKTNPYPYLLRTFVKHILSVLKISKKFVFFVWTSREYLTRYGQGSVFLKICFQGSVEITDPCLYLFKYSPDVLKKEKVLYIFNTDKKCFIKMNIELSLPEIWIRIRFLEINGSPSLLIRQYQIWLLFDCVYLSKALNRFFDAK